MFNFLKNRYTISSIAFGLILVALIVLLVIPAVKEISVINAQVYEERARLEMLYTKGQVKKEVHKKYSSIEANAGFLDNIFEQESHELEYISKIEQIAEANNISIAMATGARKRTPQQRFSELEFTFTLTGDWENILSWIEKVENMPVYTNMREITVSTHADKNNENIRQATAVISAATYWNLPN